MNTNTQETPVEEVENAIDEKVIDVAKKTMVGDLRDVCLQIMRNPKLTGKAWKDMTEAEQREVSQVITDRVTDAVITGVQIIAANGQRQIIGTLEQVLVKDGLKAVLKCSQYDALRHELADAQGDAVAIVLSGSDGFIGHRDKVKIDKDQTEMLDDPETEEGTQQDDEPTEEVTSESVED